MGAATANTTFNQDQVFSLARQAMTFVGGMFLANAVDLQTLLVGAVPIVVSVAWSLWRNADNRFDQLFSGMRQVVLLAGAYAVGKGWVSDQTFTYISGAVLAVASSVVSGLFYQNAPGPQLAGTTITDAPAG